MPIEQDAARSTLDELQRLISAAGSGNRWALWRARWGIWKLRRISPDHPNKTEIDRAVTMLQWWLTYFIQAAQAEGDRGRGMASRNATWWAKVIRLLLDDEEYGPGPSLKGSD